ncbi:MAG: hypothetical protein CMI24_07545 [Opitutae bacterium]|nr:hypothetical protein [Opitutae bacterium]MEC8419602.1 hypothetical protein [Verrucomicrobiota bacterium]
MRVLAVLFRIFSLLGLLSLAGLLWLKFDTQTKQQISFLDEVLDDAYTVLQSESKQWEEINQKKSNFNDVYEANEQIPEGEDNLLSLAVDELRTAEDVIFRNQNYRERLDLTTNEYGAGSLYWDSEAKLWKVSDGYKLESPAGFQDPFQNLNEFPYKDVKLEDGTIIKGVPRHQRLRTVIGMFYKDRHDRQSQVAKLRSMIVTRDEELRQFQNMWAREKQIKEETQDELADTQIKLKGVEADLENEKKERQNEKEAAEQQITVLNTRVAEMETEKQEMLKVHEAELDELNEEHKQILAQKQEEIRKADADGYKRGIDEMLAKTQGGEVAEDEISEEVNPFMVKKDSTPIPVINEMDAIAVANQKQISEIGAPSTIARVDSKSGMLLLPFGQERGVMQGTVFTVWKDKREAARIRVQSSRDGYLLAYILPRFGEPQKLRPGDSIYIIPEEEQSL